MERNTKRCPNLTLSETELLTNEVEKRSKILFSKQISTVSNSMEKEAWEEIAEKVNAVKSLTIGRRSEEQNRRVCLVRVKEADINKKKGRLGGGVSLPPCAIHCT
jgi:allophanate hydrolase subunit 1